MTQPSPPGSIGDLLDQLNTQAQGTSGSTTSLYGLGSWGKQTVDPGDLPFLSGIVATGGNTTGDAILKAFAGAAPDQVATVQHALYMAGYYPKTYNPKYGVISPTDITAFGNLVTTAGQAGQPVAGLLAQGAAYGAAAGIAAAQAKANAAKVMTVNLPNTTDLEASAVAAFQKILGKKATPEAAAAFAAQYRAMSAGVQRAANQQAYDAATAGAAAVAPTGDPTTLVGKAMTRQARKTLDAQTDNLPPVLSHELGTGQPKPTLGTPSFSDEIGGLQHLGQSLMQPSAQPGGLTQIDVESPVSPDVAALNYARNTHPNAAAANDIASAADVFFQLLFGNGLAG